MWRREETFDLKLAFVANPVSVCPGYLQFFQKDYRRIVDYVANPINETHEEARVGSKDLGSMMVPDFFDRMLTQLMK